MKGDVRGRAPSLRAIKATIMKIGEKSLKGSMEASMKGIRSGCFL